MSAAWIVAAIVGGLVLGGLLFYAGIRVGAQLVWRAAGHPPEEPVMGRTRQAKVEQDETE